MGLHEEWPGLDTLPVPLQAVVVGQYGKTADALIGLFEQAREDLRTAPCIVDAWGSVALRVADLLDEQADSVAEGYACAVTALALLRYAGQVEIEERRAAEQVPPAGEGSFSIAPRLTWMTMADVDAIKGPGAAA